MIIDQMMIDMEFNILNANLLKDLIINKLVENSLLAVEDAEKWKNDYHVIIIKKKWYQKFFGNKEDYMYQIVKFDGVSSELWDENQPDYKERRFIEMTKWLQDIDMPLLQRLFVDGKFVLEDLPNTDYFLLHLEYKEPDSDIAPETYFGRSLESIQRLAAATDNLILCETRKWLVHKQMGSNEFFRTCFKCIKVSQEHRAGEHFSIKGMKVYSPHRDFEQENADKHNSKLLFKIIFAYGGKLESYSKETRDVLTEIFKCIDEEGIA